MNVYACLEQKAKRNHDNHRNQALPTRLESVRSAGVEPVFLEKDQAIRYAENRASFRRGEVRILDSKGALERVIPFDDTDRRL